MSESEQPKNMSKSKAPVVTGIKPKEAVPGTEITIRHSVYIRIVRPYNLRHQKKNPETTNSPIRSAAKRPESLLKHISWCVTTIYYFNKHLKPCFFILKALKDIMQHFKFVVSSC